MPKVSVIVAVYNVEPYLRRSMDCLLNQTMQDLEFICVDDCSTDGSLSILREYEAKDNRFKIIALDKNCGAAVARNKGLEIATGEYLGFIDPDDAIDLNYYEELYNKAKEGDYDIVKGERITEFENGKVIKSPYNEKIKQKGLYIFSCEWTTAIYKKSIIDDHNIRFVESLKKGEDRVFLQAILFNIKSYALISNVYYYYYRREGSLDSRKLSLESVMSGLQSRRILLDNINKSTLYNTNPRAYSHYYTIFINDLIKNLLYRCDNKIVYKIIAEILIEYYEKCKNTKHLKNKIKPNFLVDYIENKDVDGLIKVFNKYKTYTELYMHNTLLDNIFSVKNDNYNNKIIRIFYLKIKIKRRKVVNNFHNCTGV